ncbi:MAG TPA: tetratricopeptide repeat protein [Candidatus Dormibacteraeota bacterium]|nr:tetratricopeptide repeat protein [Candidatus Dormibacteraeota bacterium]
MSEDANKDKAALLERIVAQDPSSPLYLPIAERMREQGRVEEAIRLCEERRGRPGEGVGDRIVLGRCYLAAGRLAEARSQFESAVSIDRENVIALKALAGILSHEGRHSQAADYYRAVCRIDPGDLESQSALNQITSGEFPEVRPPDLVVAQGEMTWQPVKPPPEEQYLGEISLGLHTIESFDVTAPKPYEARVQDFQEMSFDALDVEKTATPEAAVPPAPKAEAAVAPPAPKPAPEVPPPSPETPQAPEAPEVPEPALASASGTWTELPKSPHPRPEPSGPPKQQQNRSAFETWLTRLKGGRQ